MMWKFPSFVDAMIRLFIKSCDNLNALIIRLNHIKRVVLLILIVRIYSTQREGESDHLKCISGHDVRFSCPCPKKFDSCTFKKLHPPLSIVIDGQLNDGQYHRYKLDKGRGRITLTECRKGDNGTFAWICEKCNLTKHFNLFIDDRAAKNKNVECTVGDDISFKCPCCPHEFTDCRFKKLFQGGYILKDGKIGDQHTYRYAMDENRTQITLKECIESDNGTYVWMCGMCNINKQFTLEIRHHEGTSILVHPVNAPTKSFGVLNFASPSIRILFLSLFSFHIK